MNSLPVFVMGNDQILPEVIRFLNSFRCFHPTASVSFIPFDANCGMALRVAEFYSCDIVQDDLGRFNEFGHAIFDEDPPQQPYPYMLGKLRKLYLFASSGPGIYIDIDSIVLMDIVTPVAGVLSELGDLGFITRSPDWVYEEVPEAQALRAKTKAFSSSLLVKASDAFSFDLIRRTILEHRALYRSVRKRGVIDQPLLNFVVDTLDLTAVGLPTRLPVSGHTGATVESLRPTSGGSVLHVTGDKILPMLFLHAAGRQKHDKRFDYLFKSHLYTGLIRIFRSDQKLGTALLESIARWDKSIP